jgi:hypothetical protein
MIVECPRARPTPFVPAVIAPTVAALERMLVTVLKSKAVCTVEMFRPVTVSVIGSPALVPLTVKITEASLPVDAMATGEPRRE